MGYCKFGPNVTWTNVRISDRAWMHSVAFHTPIHEQLDRIYGIFGRNFFLDSKYDKTFETRALFIAEQDRYVLESMYPILTPRASENEILVATDKAIARYREYCKDWEDRGWRIDVKKMREKYDRIAYAIPSPARCQAKDWVFPATPLLSAQSAGATELKQAG